MKKLVILASALLFSVPLFAQTETITYKDDDGKVYAPKYEKDDLIPLYFTYRKAEVEFRGHKGKFTKEERKAFRDIQKTYTDKLYTYPDVNPKDKTTVKADPITALVTFAQLCLELNKDVMKYKAIQAIRDDREESCEAYSQYKSEFSENYEAYARGSKTKPSDVVKEIQNQFLQQISELKKSV